jgi:hypothetical protein
LRCSDLFSCAVGAQALSPFPSRAKPPAAAGRSARELRINARCAVMRNSRALRLRLVPDGGFDQHRNISRELAWDISAGEQYVWPEVPRRTGSPSGFGDLMGEL